MVNLNSHGITQVVCYNKSACLLPLFRDKKSDPKPAGIFVGASMSRNTRTLKELLENTVTTRGGCMEWQGSRDEHGYGRMSYRGKRGQKVTRVVMTLSGYDVSGVMVCHKCDNPSCINPDHLFLGTNSDNMRDASTKKHSKDMKHGNIQLYRNGCRCVACTEAAKSAIDLKRLGVWIRQLL